jgi:SAM-dependent methyltransferase
LYADHYDHLYAEKNYGAECDLIELAFQRYAAGRPVRVLDVGCGTGGHALELARRGYAMTGVDLSNAMLDRARSKAQELPSARRPHWICGDARDFDAGSVYDAAVMMFAVIGYLNGNEDVLRGLRNIHRHLRPGGVFVCDFWYGPSVLSVRPSDRIRVLDLPGGQQFIRATRTELDVPRHTADVSFRLWNLDGDRVSGQAAELHRLRYFFPQEFALMLGIAGFEQVGISAFPSLNQPLDEQTWNAVVVARAA